MPGLTNGDSYTFTVRATNAAGSSTPSSPSNAVTPRTVPGAPTAVGATAGNASAAVSFTVPASTGGSPITGYTVTATDSTTPGNGGQTASGTTSPITVPGLTNGDSYTFTVRATNAAGSSTPSSPSNAVTPSTVPGAPTDVAATAGNAQATVSWTAPSSDGGAPITGYAVTSTPGGRTCTVNALTCTVTGLVNGTAYTFTVTATSSRGTGAASQPSTAVTPSTVPGQPRDVRSTGGDQQATVIWTAPASDGGSPITSYVVTAVDRTDASRGGQTCTWTSGPLTCTVVGLTNGDVYAFTVVARNANGAGTATVPPTGGPATTTPSTTPGSPRDVAATRGDASALVSWTPPASDGGAPVTGYTVAADRGGSSCSAAATATSCLVPDLVNGESYTFTVTASNVNGASGRSQPSGAVTPSTVPGQPRDVRSSSGNVQATVTWTAPLSDGGSPITSYTVTAVDRTDASRGGQTCVWTSGPLTCTVTGLTNGDAYVFTVTASNTNGAGGAAAPPQGTGTVTPSSVPGTPRDVVATGGEGRATVTWTAPASDGGSPITSYTVMAVDSEGQGRGGQTCTWTSGPFTCAVTGLVNGVAYTFTVTAANDNGSGATSQPGPQSSATPVAPAPSSTPPTPPRDVTAVAGDARAVVTWTVPASDGGARITSYVVTAVESADTSAGGQSCTSTAPAVAGQEAPSTCTVEGLVNGRAYVFTVRALNGRGSSDPSAASLPVTPSAPTAPTAAPAPAPVTGRFHPVTPARLLDTRTAGGPVPVGADRELQVTGVAGVPAAGVSAVLLNVTVTQPSSRGDLQVYPAGDRPAVRTSNLNFAAGETVPVQVLTGVGPDGRIALSSSTGTAHVVVDVFGWYGDASDAIAGSSGYTALVPQRLLDTRSSRTPVLAGADRTVQVGGRAGVPSDATAVVLNTTVLGSPANADVQLAPAGEQPAVRTSNLNIRRGQTRANAVTSPLRDGKLVVSVSAGRVQVVLDVLGYYSPSSRGRFIALTPTRVLDTRADGRRLTAGQDRDVVIAGVAGVPANAVAAVLSVTGTDATRPVDLQLFPTGRRPGARTSTVNFRPGQAVANAAIAALGGGATSLSLSQGSAAAVLDVLGYMTAE